MEDYDSALSKFGLNDLIDRDKLYHLVFLKVRSEIKSEHVKSVIKILIEEVMEELFQRGRFAIDNFGALILKRVAPRSFWNYQTREMQMSNGSNILRFQLFNKLRLTILRNLDVERTFGGNDV